MRKIIYASLICISCLLLSACSLKEDVASLYKQEIPLTSEIILPESISIDNEETIKIVLSQGGKKVVDADFVHYEIWKQDGTVNYPMEEATYDEGGKYSFIKKFDKEGLYFIKVHAGNDGSIIIPQKQFVVGQLSESDKNFLKNGSQKQEFKHESHH